MSEPSQAFIGVMLTSDNTEFIAAIKQRLARAQRVNNQANVRSYRALLRALQQRKGASNHENTN